MKVIKDTYEATFSEVVEIGERHGIDVRGYGPVGAKNLLAFELLDILRQSWEFLYGNKAEAVSLFMDTEDYGDSESPLDAFPSFVLKDGRCRTRIDYARIIRSQNADYARFMSFMMRIQDEIGHSWNNKDISGLISSEGFRLKRDKYSLAIDKGFNWLEKRKIPGMDDLERREWILFLGGKKIAVDYAVKSNFKILEELRELASRFKSEAK